jgi:ribosomal protein S27E
MTSFDAIDVTCPQCSKKFSAPQSSAGTRVPCPHCASTVKIAGLTASKTEDDDWLRLDEDLPVPAPQSPVPVKKQEPVASSGTAPFDDSLDEFMIPDLPAAPPMREFKSSVVPPLSEADLDALSGIVNDDEQRPAPVKVIRETPANETFRVKCPTCESLTYAKTSQVGKTIRCGDCHSTIVVPAPPKAKVKYSPDIESAKAFTFQDTGDDGNQPRIPDPLRKSASDYLRDAEAAIDETEEEEWTLPSFGDWFKGVFGIFRDPSVIGYWIFLSVFAALPTIVALYYESSMIVMGLFVGGLLYGAILVAHGFAILQSVANGEDEVSEWPVIDFFGWMGPLFIAASAIAVSAGPVWFVTQFVGMPTLVVVGLSMLSLYFLLPFVLLSMLDEQSVLMPFSSEVSKSVTRCGEQWGLAYLTSAVLFIALFLTLVVASAMPLVMSVLVSCAATVAAVFLYSGILGRLAFSIGHAVNAPPMVNEIERNPKMPD